MFSSDSSFCADNAPPDARGGPAGATSADETEPTVPNTTVTNDIIRDLIDREAPRMCRLARAPNHTPPPTPVKAELTSHRNGSEALPPIRLIHPKFGGQASFRTFREAALCILLMDGAPLLDFVRWASEMKTQIKRDPACVPRNEFWRYFLLHDPSIPEQNGLVTPRAGGGMTSDAAGDSEPERMPPSRKLKVAAVPIHNRTQPLPPPSDREDGNQPVTPETRTKLQVDTAASDSDTEGDAIGRGRKRRQMRRPKGHTLQQ